MQLQDSGFTSRGLRTQSNRRRQIVQALHKTLSGLQGSKASVGPHPERRIQVLKKLKPPKLRWESQPWAAGFALDPFVVAAALSAADVLKHLNSTRYSTAPHSR